MIKVKFNGKQFSIRQDVGVEELKQLFLKEPNMHLERKDDEDGTWFEVIDIADAELCEGAEFRAKKVSNKNVTAQRRAYESDLRAINL